MYFIGHGDLTDFESNFTFFLFLHEYHELWYTSYIIPCCHGTLKTHRCLSPPCRNTSQTVLAARFRAVRINAVNLSQNTHVIRDVKFSHVSYLMQYFILAVH